MPVEFKAKRECQWQNLGLKEESVGLEEVSGRVSERKFERKSH